jgi:C-terminal processing protease CtpA/Prc
MILFCKLQLISFELKYLFYSSNSLYVMFYLKITLERGKHGYGFSVVEESPVKIGRVDGASPAETAGLHPGDCIVKVNGQNVSRSQAASVAKLVK